MRIVPVITILVSILAFSGCADLVMDSENYQLSQLTTLTVNIEDGTKGAITTETNQIVNAVIKLTDPSGKIQTAMWNVSLNQAVSFTTTKFGTHDFNVLEIDSSNYSNTIDTNLSLLAGFNYRITVTLIGVVVVTNADSSSSSTSISSSSVSSSASSVSSSSSSPSSSSSTGPLNTFGIYGETVPVSVLWDTDTKLDIWTDWGANMTIVDDVFDYAEGNKSWKITGTGAWVGMGIRVNPLTSLKDMNSFSVGSVRFMAKSSIPFKVGVKSGGTAPVEKWVLPADLPSYGFTADNQWHSVVIPMTAFSGVDFTKIEQYFMFASDVPMGYVTGSIYHIDGLYWSKVPPVSSSSSSSVSSSSSSVSSVMSSSVSSVSSTPSSSSVISSSSSSHTSSVSSVSSFSSSVVVSSSSSSVSSASPNIFGIYSETVPLNVTWGSTVMWAGNDGTSTVTEQSSVVGEGSKALQFTMAGSGWLEQGTFVLPNYTFTDMSAYNNGTLSFMVKTPYMLGVGMKSGLSLKVFLMLTNGVFGFKTNNTWCTVNIPMSIFRNAGIDFTAISMYFDLYAANSYGSIPGMPNGTSVYADNITISKTYTSSSSSSSVSSSSSSVVSSSSSSHSSSSSSSSSSVVSSSSSSSSSLSLPPIISGQSIVLYAETAAMNVVWPTDINTNESPSDPNLIEFTTATAGEGTHSFHIHVNSNMFNVNWLRYPLVTYLDLSAYAGGKLNFMIKATKFISVSIHMAENYDIMVHLTNDGMYGFHTNNQWCSVSIPMSYWAGMDLTRLYGWLKFYGGYYEGIVGGEDYYIDRVFFSK